MLFVLNYEVNVFCPRKYFILSVGAEGERISVAIGMNCIQREQILFLFSRNEN
jgi:hypothetical protein